MPAAPDAIAVFDLGKTNAKMLVYGADGTVRAEARRGPAWRESGGLSVLDHEALGRWMADSLAQAADAHPVGGVTVSGHGCTFALVRGRELLHPILDYEQDVPDAVAARTDPLLPPFGETFAPRLPQGLTMARHVLWLEDSAGEVFSRAEALLCYPQFWTWSLGGRPVGEVSYLGCHSGLWAPLSGDYSSLVDQRGWRALMPPLARAGEPVGTMPLALPGGGSRTLTLHNGVHDSNASLSFYRALGHSGFTMVSTGTWVIVMNPDCPLDGLDPARDMLANVTVDRQPVATARFMGGREFDVLSGGLKRPIPYEALADAIAHDAMALPSFAAGGPFPGRKGRILAPAAPSGDGSAAIALLYVALMTDLVLDLTRAAGPLILDGGLTRLPAYPGLLAALRPGQPVLVGTQANGSASGAAALAFEASGRQPFTDDCRPVAALHPEGLHAYRQRWRERVASM